MKLLHIINSLNTGGAEKLIIETLPQYEKLGLKVDLLVLVDHDYPFLKILKENFHGKIYILGKGSVYNPLVIGELSEIMKGYDIAHVHLFPAQYFALIANKINGNKTKLIFTEHSTSNRRIRNKFSKPLEKFIYENYNKTICITDKVKEVINNHVSIDEDKLDVIKNGVNLKSIYNSEPYDNFTKLSTRINENDKLILQVSSMQVPKDQKTLIASLNFLPENYKVILVGDGVMKAELEAFTKSKNLLERVVFLGKRNDVPRILKTVHFIVLSSRYEGLSLSSIEGMASGKPFIASDVPGLTEIVQGYGVLFPAGDSKTLANEILKLDNDKKYYNRVVEKCLERAEDFDIKNMINQHIKLYEQFQN